MESVSQLHTFEQSSREVLAFLHRKLGFSLWMVTRIEGNDWIVLQSEDHGYHVKAGDVFKWTDSFCSQMVLGNGPFIAPDSNLIPAYACAPIGQQVDIGAYIGFPLHLADGSLFGTLCAIDPQIQPDNIQQEQEMIALFATILSRLLQTELSVLEQARRADKMNMEAHLDCMTKLYNRRAWDELLHAENERCARYGNPACVLVIDLDGLKTTNDQHGHAEGDQLILKAAQAISASTRDSDVVARIGGDEFAVLAIESDYSEALQLKNRIESALQQIHISASIGVAMRDPRYGLEEAVKRADQYMYHEKVAHKNPTA